jgi:methyl-accepting chemotaxis protein
MSREQKYNKQSLPARSHGPNTAVLERPADSTKGVYRSEQNQDRRVLDEIFRLVEASRAGHLSDRGRAEQFTGDDRKLIEGVNSMLDAILLPIGEGNRVLAQISVGKIDELITQSYNGDHEKMKMAVNNVATVLQGLQKEMARLTKASHEGQLSERGKPEVFQGAYADVVKGVNEMLDAILLPIGEGNRILRLIRGGNLREKVEIACKGDHEQMKNAINGVHAWLAELIAYVTKIANGDMAASMAKASDQDQIQEWLVLLKNNINALVADAALLAKAAVEGKLATRADATKHQGDYRKIVEGVNNTLDAVIGPLNVAADYVDKISKGAIPAKISESYNGDFNAIKNNLNNCVDNINALVADAALLAKAAADG